MKTRELEDLKYVFLEILFWYFSLNSDKASLIMTIEDRYKDTG